MHSFTLLCFQVIENRWGDFIYTLLSNVFTNGFLQFFALTNTYYSLQELTLHGLNFFKINISILQIVFCCGHVPVDFIHVCQDHFIFTSADNILTWSGQITNMDNVYWKHDISQCAFGNWVCFRVMINMGGDLIDAQILINPLRAKLFGGSIKHIFTFYVIPPHWYHTGGRNPSSNKDLPILHSQ